MKIVSEQKSIKFELLFFLRKLVVERQLPSGEYFMLSLFLCVFMLLLHGLKITKCNMNTRCKPQICLNNMNIVLILPR